MFGTGAFGISTFGELPTGLTAGATNPPFKYGGPVAVMAAIISLWQPDPWVYDILGGGSVANQPYGPRQTNPSLTAVQVDNPPFDRRRIETNAQLIQAAQPPIWPVVFIGGAQPYAPRLTSPGIPGREVTEPPFDPRLIAEKAAIVSTIWAPDPWVFAYHGGAQPYAPRLTSPGIPGREVTEPPFSRRRAEERAAIVSVWQPDPWVFAYHGGAQPYAPRLTSPGIPGREVTEPPFSRRRAEERAAIASVWQPDPWVYDYLGNANGREPYGPRQLGGRLNEQQEDNPPFDKRRNEIRAAIIQATQPPIWPYVSIGGAQPYAPKLVNPGIPGRETTNPPFRHPGRDPGIQAIVVQLAQPPVWPFVYIGAAQPYAPMLVGPAIPGRSVNQPPFDRRRLEINIELVQANQPPIWPYLFIGGDQPYAPAPLDPVEEGIIAPPPGAGKRPDIPGWTPQPAWDAKPQKPFRPVWDKPKGGEIEVHRFATPEPVPLPPASIFAQGAKSTLDTAALPTFDEYVPNDPLGLSKRMKDAQDLSDAYTVLRALGLLPPDNQG